MKVAEKTLGALTKFLDEEICVVPAGLLATDVPAKGLVKERKVIDQFVQLVNQHKRFVRRSEAEADPRLIQPIPCAIIRWQDRILLLQRTKKGHALHNKFLLWAGGRVNRGDDSQDILMKALERELSEEVFIRSAYEVSQQPIALLRTDEDARASRHIGVLYEITLANSDIALAMNQKEFKETRGTSMSGKLVDPSELTEVYDKLNDWSKSMVQYFWPSLPVVPKAPLFSD